jgi:secondary thiamine-phosphate synthase enzyme
MFLEPGLSQVLFNLNPIMIFKKKKNYNKTISFTPNYGKRLYDITPLIELAIDDYKPMSGLINILLKANTAAIMIQENGESHFKKDFMKFINTLFSSYNTNYELFDTNNGARLMASMIGPSVTIPVINGKLLLSKNQKVFLCEFDEPNIEREILITPFRN